MSEENKVENKTDEKKRVYYFKGKSYEELKSLNQAEMLKIIGARARRSLQRGFDKPKQDLMAKVKASNELIKQGNPQLKIKTHSRDMVIIPEMIDLKIEVHTGKTFEPVTVKQEMLGHYLGEFALTRKKVTHGSGNKAVEAAPGKPAATAQPTKAEAKSAAKSAAKPSGKSAKPAEKGGKK